MDQYSALLDRAGVNCELWNLPNKTPKLRTTADFLRPFLKDRSNIIDVKELNLETAS